MLDALSSPEETRFPVPFTIYSDCRHFNLNIDLFDYLTALRKTNNGLDFTALCEQITLHGLGGEQHLDDIVYALSSEKAMTELGVTLHDADRKKLNAMLDYCHASQHGDDDGVGFYAEIDEGAWRQFLENF